MPGRVARGAFRNLTGGARYGNGYGMPSASKATYSLDAASLERLARLSRRWQVSKTEVLRRALTQATENDAPSPEDRIAALHTLQRWAKEKKIDLEKWKQTIRDGRR